MNWAPFPLLRIAIALSAGILCQEYLALPFSFGIIGFVISVFGWILLEQFWSNLISKSTITGFALLTATFFIGVMLLNARYIKLERQAFPEDEVVLLTGTLTERLKSSNKIRFVFHTDYRRTKDKLEAHRSKIILSFDPSDSLASDYLVGHHLAVRLRLKKAMPNSNPEAFDYSQYLKYKGIEYLGKVKMGDHKMLAANGFGLFRNLANKSTLFTDKVIHKYIHDEEASSIAEALLIGQQLNISQEIYKSYADTGAIHVLSVSGMHVAIFIAVFLYLFNQVKRRSLLWKIFKVSMLLLIVWFYVILTGMAPSVLRAGTMVSLYVIGSTFFKGYNTYNVLAFAAMLMLFYEPFYLFQLSFQLSFISLLSILFFQPRIAQWWKPSNKVLKFCWSLVNVSLAAQIMIFPLSILIFHQFSLSFALSSLLAVPLVSFIIYGGTAMVLAELVWESLAHILGVFLEYMIVLLNYVILQISKLPYSVLTDVYISEIGFIVLAFAVLSLMYWSKTFEKSSLYLTFFSLCFVFAGVSLDKLQKRNQAFLVIYDLYGNDVLDLGLGKKIFRHVSGAQDDDRIDQVAHGFMVKNRIKQVHLFSQPMLQFQENLIYVCNSREDVSRLKAPIAPKYMYIAGNDLGHPERILERVFPDTLILNPNLKPWISKKWVALQHNCGYAVHDIKKEGAFVKVYR
ncbi:MAG: ComEC family competence protein [Chitinophagales bacterium]|nr:ComEC family competence protein [Chitinophagales bacterium]